MPHYADGTEAKIGDIVKGISYNVKHEIIGKVVNVRPGESCTLSVATVTKKTPVHFTSMDGETPSIAKEFAACHVVAELEYGDTKCFTKIA
jgi:hypothetical protein